MREKTPFPDGKTLQRRFDIVFGGLGLLGILATGAIILMDPRVQSFFANTFNSIKAAVK